MLFLIALILLLLSLNCLLLPQRGLVLSCYLYLFVELFVHVENRQIFFDAFLDLVFRIQKVYFIS